MGIPLGAPAINASQHIPGRFGTVTFDVSSNSNNSGSSSTGRGEFSEHLPEGFVLGDFVVGPEIGRGGMGIVYKAWEQSLQRQVALKVLAGHVSASPTAVARFQREAQAAAKLHHTGIVPIFAQGEQNGTFYYAMELVEGSSLYDIIQEQRAAQNGAASPVSTASEPATGSSNTRPAPEPQQHAADPSGIDPEATVAVARSAAPANGSPATFGVATTWPTPTGEHFTAIAHYIAEVAEGLTYAHSHGVIHRDIKPHNLILGNDDRMRILDFGLARLAEQPGVTATGELLGSPLYMSPEQISGDSGDIDSRTDIYSLGVTMYEWLTRKPPYPGETRERVITRIMAGNPTPPSLHDPAIPADLETICLKAIARKSESRYATAAEFRDDLRRFVARQPIRAKREGFARRTWRFVQQHPAATTAVVSALFVGVLGAAWYRARSHAHSLTAAAASAEQQRDALLDLVRGLPLVGAVGQLVDPNLMDPSQLSLPGFGDASSDAGAEVGTPAATTARIAVDFFAASPPEPWPPPETGAQGDNTTFLRTAAKLWNDGDREMATELLDAYLTKLEMDERVHFIPRWIQAAWSAETKQFDQMAQAGEAMVRLQPDSPISRIWRGLAYLLIDKTNAGVTDLKAASEMLPDSPWARLAYGMALIHDGRAEGAVLELEDAMRLAPDLPIAPLALGQVYHITGRHSEAIDLLNQVIQAGPGNAHALTILGDAYAAMGRFTQAVAQYQAATQIVGNTTTLGMRIFSVLMQQRANNAVKTTPASPRAMRGVAPMRPRQGARGLTPANYALLVLTRR